AGLEPELLADVFQDERGDAAENARHDAARDPDREPLPIRPQVGCEGKIRLPELSDQLGEREFLLGISHRPEWKTLYERSRRRETKSGHGRGRRRSKYQSRSCGPHSIQSTAPAARYGP